jgi:hypothetical protein
MAAIETVFYSMSRPAIDLTGPAIMSFISHA